jgi:putative spermidine/putrescine transport system ATP-binding protein
MGTILELVDLTIDFGGAKPAVDGVNLAVDEGEIVSLLGPSGCGKTTTMRAITGLLAPTTGLILLSGADVTRLAPNRRGVGMVFQSYALFPHLTVFENVAFGLRLRGDGFDSIRARVADMLTLVGLAPLGERLPREISGGQQQRVALARALAPQPKLLLLDEPLSNLDARLRIEMRAELARIQRESGITMIYVTHDQTEALALSSRIVVMNEGRIEQVAVPETVWRRPATAFVARFMGYETILACRGGRLTNGEGEGLAADAGFREGIRYAWRPGNVAIGSGPHSGIVAQALFQGDSILYALETPVGIVRSEVPAATRRHAAGSAVAFDLDVNRAAELP